MVADVNDGVVEATNYCSRDISCNIFTPLIREAVEDTLVMYTSFLR